MKKQGGFALFLILIVAAAVMGVVYARVVKENTEAIQANSRAVALKLYPAIDALSVYALTQYVSGSTDNTFEGSDFYGSEYSVSSSYQNVLNGAGFNTDAVSVSFSDTVLSDKGSPPKPQAGSPQPQGEIEGTEIESEGTQVESEGTEVEPEIEVE